MYAPNNSFKPRPLRGSACVLACSTPPFRKAVRLNSGVSHMKAALRFTAILAASLLASCTADKPSQMEGSAVEPQPAPPSSSHQEQPPPPPPPPLWDFGDLDNFGSCKAEPRRVLSSKEKCQIEKLREDCTPAADCLVTCLSSPDGIKIGGKCDHVCFYPRHPWESRPKVMDECE